MQSSGKEKGKYIVFEGLPKCGKSTQANLLYEKLAQKFPERKIILTKEPGGSEIAEVIRKLVQGTPFTEQMTPVLSSKAFQGGARGLGINIIDEINRVALHDSHADKVFFLDTDPKVCYERAKKQYDGSDKFEAMDFDFFEKIRNGYKSFSFAMETIPGDFSIENIHGLILVSVLKLLHGNY